MMEGFRLLNSGTAGSFRGQSWTNGWRSRARLAKSAREENGALASARTQLTCLEYENRARASVVKVEEIDRSAWTYAGLANASMGYRATPAPDSGGQTLRRLENEENEEQGEEEEGEEDHVYLTALLTCGRLERLLISAFNRTSPAALASCSVSKSLPAKTSLDWPLV